jgi:hypothetical protein
MVFNTHISNPMGQDTHTHTHRHVLKLIVHNHPYCNIALTQVKSYQFPLQPDINEASENGIPYVIKEREGACAKTYASLATDLVEGLSQLPQRTETAEFRKKRQSGPGDWQTVMAITKVASYM